MSKAYSSTLASELPPMTLRRVAKATRVPSPLIVGCSGTSVARAVPANLCITEADDAGRIGQLRKAVRDCIANENFEIAVAILFRQIAVRRECDEASIVRNRSLKISVCDSV